MCKLTIFTPTYNRAHLLSNLYNSLIQQTNKNFIWLIIDDGSTDNTFELVNSFKKEDKIKIKYIYQKNKGKHAAHNKAVSVCNTALFFCVDSDDCLTNDAVEIILSYNTLNQDMRLLGFYFRKGSFDGEPHGENFPSHLDVVHISELYDKYKFKGEMAIILKTELIKGYNFPEFDEEKFITESVFYYQINDLFPMLIVDKVIYLFEYMTDGYTKNALALATNNPKGTAMSYLFSAHYSKHYFLKVKKTAQFFAWKKVMNIDSVELKKISIPFSIRIFSVFLYNYYKKKFREFKMQTFVGK
jgi:glycosyltransferase involved in cell wall biosynthesis